MEYSFTMEKYSTAGVLRLWWVGWSPICYPSGFLLCPCTLRTWLTWSPITGTSSQIFIVTRSTRRCTRPSFERAKTKMTLLNQPQRMLKWLKSGTVVVLKLSVFFLDYIFPWKYIFTSRRIFCQAYLSKCTFCISRNFKCVLGSLIGCWCEY